MVGEVAPHPQRGSFFIRFFLKKIIFVLLFPLWGLGGFGYSQTPFEFKQIKDKEGVSANTINCFLQDKDGFLWIGTYDGLKRYSGGHTQVFRPNRRDSTSITNNVIHKICEDPAGRIWCATGNGICYFDKKKNRFEKIKTDNKKSSNSSHNILYGMDGNIWFASNAVADDKSQSIIKYNFETNKYEVVGKFPPRTIVKNGFAEDKLNQGIFFGTTQGLQFYDYRTKTLQNHFNNPQKISVLTQNPVSALTIDGNQLLFIDNSNGELVFFDLSQRKISKTLKINSKIKHPYFDAATTFVDKNHHVWVATWHYELFYIEPENNKIVQMFRDKTKATSIAAEFTWGGWIQKDGSIWLGTTNGISIYNPEQRFYNTHDLSQLFPALDEEFGVNTFVEDSSDGSWWLGTYYRGLLKYFPKTQQLKIYKLPNKTAVLPYGGIINDLIEYNGKLYFTSGGSLYEFNKKTEVFKKLNQNPIQNKLVLQNDKLWVTVKDKIITSYHMPTDTWKNYDLSALFLNKTHVLNYPFVDFKGRYGILSDKEGVLYYNSLKDEFEIVRRKMTLNLFNFESYLIPDNSNYLWLYGRDILKINLNTYEVETVFENERIGHAVIDNQQNHWMGLYNRYIIFNPKTNLSKQFELPFGHDNSKYETHLFKLKNGNILSGQKSNLIEFSPKILSLNSPVGEILLDNISLPDSSFLLHSDSSKVNLKYSQNTFTIAHGILNQFDEAKYQYFYQLNGLSDKWTATNENSTTFTNLDGGDYIYSIKGIRADGKSTPTRTLFIHINTIYYKTAWFKLIGGLIFLSVIASFLSFRSNQRKKIHHLQIQSTRLEKDKTEIQYQNLINHLNPHFLFNSLTSLNSLIITEPKQASKFLQKLSAIYRYILQSKDKETVTLEHELNFVKNYIDLQKSRFEDGLEIKITIEEEYLGLGIVPVTLQNLFENAIKHNTIEDDKPLVIEVFVEDDFLVVKNNLQKKNFVETSNKQGLDSLKTLYSYLTTKPFETVETETEFIVRVPLI
jgi:hypothetical protein